MDVSKYKVSLEAELIEITKQLETLGIHNPEVSEDWIPLPQEKSDTEPDPNIFGDRSEEWQEIRGTLDILEARFNNINRALHKITDDKYGLCEIDGKLIEKDRLDANAAARTCKKHLDEEVTLPQ